MIEGIAQEGPKTVLLVEDSPAQRLMVAAQLRRCGYDVLEAPHAEAALEILREGGVRLVLSDWMMPGLDGPDLCRAVRALGREDYVYFVLMTARSERQAVTDGLNAGADDFVQKPVDPAELVARLTAGSRLVAMQQRLAEQQRATEVAYDEIRKLYDCIERDLAVAAVLQREALPAPSAMVNGAAIGTLCRFAGHVGGDHVGFFPIGERVVGLYSIDVSGHGVASSLLAITLAQHFNPANPQENIAIVADDPNGLEAIEPAEVMRTLNDRFRASDDHDLYFTMIYATIDVATGDTAIACAGHSPAAVLAPDGSVRFIEVGAGPPVGLIEEVDYPQGSLTLAPGERIFLYSDGITEAGSEKPDAMLGTVGLARILSPLAERDVADVLPALLHGVEHHLGGLTFDDDVSALLYEQPVGRAAAALTGTAAPPHAA